MAAGVPSATAGGADRATHIVLVAGETSGDNLGAGLIEALRARRPNLLFEGIAGPRMTAAGCTPWAKAERLAVMGLVEVLGHLPDLWRLRNEVEARTLALRPAAFVGIDAAEFNLSLAARLHRRGLKTVQYVSPQVWAWRQGRVSRMARTLNLVLCLLPFETPFYQHAGLAAEFVGHPLADRLPLVPDRAAARRELGLSAEAPLVAILPGSRRGEVERLARDFLGAAAWLAAARPEVRFIAPMANPEARALFSAALARPGLPSVQLIDGQADRVLTAANVALVASGTATLETLLCKRPMVVAYRVARSTAWLAAVLGLMRAPFFAQPNLLAGREIVPEIFQEQVTPERLGSELKAFLDDAPRVAALEAEFARIHASLRRGGSARAADAILALIDAGAPLSAP